MPGHLAPTIAVLGIILAVPAADAVEAGSLTPGLRLACSLQQGGNVTIANQSQTDVPPRTPIELRSGSGHQITVLAPSRGIPVKGRLNLRNTGLAGSGCTARTVTVLSQ
jgi:hypothetical protein